MADWLSAQERLKQGLTNPDNARLTADEHPGWWWGTTPAERASGTAEAIPLGSIADPVSAIASYLSTPALSALKAAIARPATVPFRGSFLTNERGSVGGESSYDALRRETMARANSQASPRQLPPQNAPVPAELIEKFQRPDVVYWQQAPVRPQPAHGWRYSGEGLQRMRESLKNVQAPIDDIFQLQQAIPEQAQQNLIVLGNLGLRDTPLRWGADATMPTTGSPNGLKQWLTTYLGQAFASPQAALKAGYIEQSALFGKGYYVPKQKFYQEAMQRIMDSLRQ